MVFGIVDRCLNNFRLFTGRTLEFLTRLIFNSPTSQWEIIAENEAPHNCD